MSRLSSRLTSFYMLFLAMFPLLLVWTLIDFAIDPQRFDQFWDDYGYDFVYFTGLTIFFGWLLLRVVRLEMSQDSLRIKRFTLTAELELKDVEEVKGGFMLVWVHFRMQTPFGSRIAFFPRWRWSPLVSRHPVVEEMRHRALRAKQWAT